MYEAYDLTCKIWKILWELASRWAKLCEISSHNVRYGMNGSPNILDSVLSVSYFQHWQKNKHNILHHIYILQSF